MNMDTPFLSLPRPCCGYLSKQHKTRGAALASDHKEERRGRAQSLQALGRPENIPRGTST